MYHFILQYANSTILRFLKLILERAVIKLTSVKLQTVGQRMHYLNKLWLWNKMLSDACGIWVMCYAFFSKNQTKYTIKNGRHKRKILGRITFSFWVGTKFPDISWITQKKNKKLAEYLVYLSKLKSGSLWVQWLRETILKCVETSKETIFCNNIHFAISCRFMPVYLFPCQVFYLFILWFLQSLVQDQAGHWTQERNVQSQSKYQQHGNNISKNFVRIFFLWLTIARDTV